MERNDVFVAGHELVYKIATHSPSRFAAPEHGQGGLGGWREREKGQCTNLNTRGGFLKAQAAIFKRN